MATSTWRAVLRAFPGPFGLSVWIAVTVPVPLVFFDLTHRWEERPDASTVQWWTLAALPVLAFVAATRWTARAGARPTGTALVATIVVATLIAAVYLCLSLAIYSWIIPLPDPVGWTSALGLPLAAVGAAMGSSIRPRDGDQNRRPGRRWYGIGAVIAVFGAVLAPITVRLGAQDSTIRYDEGKYGSVQSGAPVGQPIARALPAAGRYAIYGVGFAPQPECRISGQNFAERSTTLVTMPPGDYGGDYATLTWFAYFDVPAAGDFSITCRPSDWYVVGDVPEIRGAVGVMIHWALPIILLLGALTGAMIIADTARRRLRRRQLSTGRPASATLD
jgi:hypothetical protein